MILLYRLLCCTEKYTPPHPKLLALAGIFPAGLLLALWIVGVYVDHDRSCSKR